jgi:hypothetical protein
MHLGLVLGVCAVGGADGDDCSQTPPPMLGDIGLHGKGETPPQVMSNMTVERRG